MNIPDPALLAERLWLRQNRKLQAAALLCAVLLLLELSFYFAAVRPLGAGIAEREARNADLRKQYAAAVLFQQQKKTISGISSAAPAQKDMPLLVKELEQDARRLNLHVAAVKYDLGQTGGEGMARLSFSFPVAGRYPELKRFIYDVETSGRLVGVDSLDMKADHGSVNLELKLVTYVRAQ